MSFTVMEQMVIGAVKGAPVTSSSKTDHFKIRPRAQTPGPGLQSDSENSSRAEYHSGPETDTSEESSAGRKSKGLESFNETDSSGEMALITQAFKEPFSCVPSSRGVARADPTQVGFESTEQSSFDATLSELRTQTPPAQPPVSSSGKLQVKEETAWPHPRRSHEGGVLLQNWLDPFVYLWASRSSSQSLYGLVPYMQAKYLCEDQGHTRDSASPQDRETSQA